MKLHEAHELPIKHAEEEWEITFENCSQGIVFSDTFISSLKRGLKLGLLLELPSKLACNFHHLNELLCGSFHNPITRPFKHVTWVYNYILDKIYIDLRILNCRKCFEAVQEFFPSPEHNLTMMTVLRSVYDAHLSKNIDNRTLKRYLTDVSAKL